MSEITIYTFIQDDDINRFALRKISENESIRFFDLNKWFKYFSLSSLRLVICWRIHCIILSIFFRFLFMSRSHYFNYLKSIEIKNQILIGDFLIACLIRDSQDTLLRKNFYTLIFPMKFIFKSFSAFYNKIWKREEIFFFEDYSYFEGVIYRLALFFEKTIYAFDETSGKLKPVANFEPAIVKRRLRRFDKFSRNFGVAELYTSVSGIDVLKSIVEGKHNYIYMQTRTEYSQLNFSISSDRLYSKYCEKKPVLVFLHLTSDAQFEYGLDGFFDLDQWLFSLVRVCIRNSWRVLLRPHPNMIAQPGSADSNYFEIVLERLFNISVENDFSYEILDPDFKLTELVSEYGDAVFVSHHGSVASELALLGRKCLVSTASPYDMVCDRFVLFYECEFSLESRIEDVFMGRCSDKVDETSFKTLVEFSEYKFIICPDYDARNRIRRLSEERGVEFDVSWSNLLMFGGFLKFF